MLSVLIGEGEGRVEGPAPGEDISESRRDILCDSGGLLGLKSELYG